MITFVPAYGLMNLFDFKDPNLTERTINKSRAVEQ